MPKVGAVAKQIQTEVDGFKKNLPVIRALTTEGFKERHIAQIVKTLDCGQIEGNENLSFYLNFSAGETDKKNELEEIADTAQKEYSNEKILDVMFADWVPLEFTPSV